MDVLGMYNGVLKDQKDGLGVYIEKYSIIALSNKEKYVMV